MNIKLRSVIIQLLLLGAGVLMLYLAFRGQNLEKLLSDLRRANYWYVAASLSMLLLAHFIRALRWQMLIKPIGFNPSALHCFCGVMIGYLANMAVPRLGEITRCSIIYRTDKAPMDKLIGTVITERIADVVLLLLLIAGVICLEADLIIRFIHDQFGGMANLNSTSGLTFKLKLFALGIMIIAVLVFFLRKKRELILSLAPVKKITGFLQGVLSGVKTISAMQRKGLFILYSLLIWFLYAVSTWLVFLALQATSMLNFSEALYVLVAGSIGMIAPVQGGIGTYHFMVTQALVLLGIASTEGLAYATLNHSSQLLLFLFAGSLALAYLLLRGIKINKTQPSHHEF